MAARTVATPSCSDSTVAAMSKGGRRFTTSQRVARSTSLRASSTTEIRASTSMESASSSSCRQKAGMSNTSRATSQALVSSGTDAPVSSASRNRNVDPPVSTIWFTTDVVMISRCSRWPSIALAKRVSQRGREVARQLGSQVRVIGQAGAEHVGGRGDLRVREQHRQLRRGEAAAGRPPLGDLPVSRQPVLR